MPKAASERVLDSFKNESASNSEDQSNLLGDVKDYTQQLRSVWADVCKSVNRDAILVVALIVIFELLAYQGAGKEFTIGPFSFANTSIVQLCLPSVIAYLVYDLYALSIRASNTENVYTELMKQFASRIYSNDLHFFITPLLPSFWSPTNLLSDEIATTADRFAEFVKALLSAIVLMIIPLIFEIQAFYHLFEKFGSKNPLLWINVAITALLGCCSAIALILDNRRS